MWTWFVKFIQVDSVYQERFVQWEHRSIWTTILQYDLSRMVCVCHTCYSMTEAEWCVCVSHMLQYDWSRMVCVCHTCYSMTEAEWCVCVTHATVQLKQNGVCVSHMLQYDWSRMVYVFHTCWGYSKNNVNICNHCLWTQSSFTNGKHLYWSILYIRVLTVSYFAWTFDQTLCAPF